MSDLIINGDGDTSTNVEPGTHVVKNGKGTATLWLSGEATIDKDGPGELHLKGLNDYSGVIIDPMNGDGSVFYSPGDVRPPTVRRHDGKGIVSGK